MALEKELEVYQRERESLLAHEGEYVLISGDEVLGTFGAYEDALRAGYQQCGDKPFLVKKIEGVERLQSFTRDILR